MNKRMSRWWPYLTIGIAAVVVSVAYPAYFRWWDHKSCHDSGGEWSSQQHECIEPRNTDIPGTRGAKALADDDQDGRSSRSWLPKPSATSRSTAPEPQREH